MMGMFHDDHKFDSAAETAMAVDWAIEAPALMRRPRGAQPEGRQRERYRIKKRGHLDRA